MGRVGRGRGPSSEAGLRGGNIYGVARARANNVHSVLPGNSCLYTSTSTPSLYETTMFSRPVHSIDTGGFGEGCVHWRPLPSAPKRLAEAKPAAAAARKPPSLGLQRSNSNDAITSAPIIANCVLTPMVGGPRTKHECA